MTTQIRLPPGLHAQLVEHARAQGISLNAVMVTLLAGGIGFTLDGERAPQGQAR